MVEEDEWLTDDSCKQTDGTVDAGATALEVFEAAVLEGAELRVWRGFCVVSFEEKDGTIKFEGV